MKDEWTGIEIRKAITRFKEINKELKIDLINDCKEQKIEFENLKVVELRDTLIKKMYEDLKLSQEDIAFIESKPKEATIKEYINKRKTKPVIKKVDADLELFKFLRGRNNS